MLRIPLPLELSVGGLWNSISSVDYTNPSLIPVSEASLISGDSSDFEAGYGSWSYDNPSLEDTGVFAGDNRTFETGTGDWIKWFGDPFERSTDWAAAGTYSLRCPTWGGYYCNLNIETPLAAGTYVAEIKCKTTEGVSVFPWCMGYDTNDYEEVEEVGTGTTQTVQIEIIFTGDESSPEIGMICDAADVYIDEVILYAASQPTTSADWAAAGDKSLKVDGDISISKDISSVGLYSLALECNAVSPLTAELIWTASGSPVDSDSEIISSGESSVEIQFVADDTVDGATVSLSVDGEYAYVDNVTLTRLGYYYPHVFGEVETDTILGSTAAHFSSGGFEGLRIPYPFDAGEKTVVVVAQSDKAHDEISGALFYIEDENQHKRIRANISNHNLYFSYEYIPNNVSIFRYPALTAENWLVDLPNVFVFRTTAASEQNPRGKVDLWINGVKETQTFTHGGVGDITGGPETLLPASLTIGAEYSVFFEIIQQIFDGSLIVLVYDGALSDAVCESFYPMGAIPGPCMGIVE